MNTLFIFQVLGGLLSFLVLLLMYANHAKQKEINVCLDERLSLIKKCNKLMGELVLLRKELRQKNDLIFELQEKINNK
jgi:hypothetical protein